MSNINNIEIVVPPSYEGILPVSPSRRHFAFEPYAFLGLKAVIEEGDVVFDVGSSYGIMSALIAKRIGAKGNVVAFEANPEVQEKVKNLIEANGFTQRIRYVNAVVGSRTGENVDFYMVPGPYSVTSTRNPNVLTKHPLAQIQKVTVIALDDYCREHDLHPQCLKIDVEGSESAVIQGALGVLRKTLPHLVIETHGTEIKGISGSLPELCDVLEGLGYPLFDLIEGVIIKGADYADKYRYRIGHILASILLNNSTFVSNLMTMQKQEVDTVRALTKLHETISEARSKINLGEHSQALGMLTELIRQFPYDGETHYLIAICLHTQNKFKQALEHYDMAITFAFDEFWVRYGRGSLLIKLNDLGEAKKDLERAFALNPNHSGVRSLMEQISDK